VVRAELLRQWKHSSDSFASLKTPDDLENDLVSALTCLKTQALHELPDNELTSKVFQKLTAHLLEDSYFVICSTCQQIFRSYDQKHLDCPASDTYDCHKINPILSVK
jgi:hypothetical protein